MSIPLSFPTITLDSKVLVNPILTPYVFISVFPLCPIRLPLTMLPVPANTTFPIIFAESAEKPPT